MKVAAAYHPIIQKVVDELLAKGVIEPSSGGAGFYSSVFVVPKHTGGPWPILNFKQFNCYLHIPSFKLHTIRHVQQLIQHGDYAFSIELQDAYLHIPLVKHHCNFYNLFGTIHHICRMFYFWMATAPSVFTALTKPVLFLCHHKGFCIVIYLDDILVLVCCKWAGKRAHTFLCSSLFALDYILVFPSLTFASLRHFVFWGVMLGYCPYVNSFAS